MDDAPTDLAVRLRPSVAHLHRRPHLHLPRGWRASASGNVSPAAMSILGPLDQHESLTLGEPATLELVHPPTITPLAGVVVRHSDPRAGVWRGALVTLITGAFLWRSSTSRRVRAEELDPALG